MLVIIGAPAVPQHQAGSSPIDVLSSQDKDADLPTPPNVPLSRAVWSLPDGILGSLKGGWGVRWIVRANMCRHLLEVAKFAAPAGSSLEGAMSWVLPIPVEILKAKIPGASCMQDVRIS